MIPILDTLIGLFDKGLDKAIPDANTRLQQATELAKLAYRETELMIQDMASARAREMAVKDYTPAVLAGVITLGFMGGTYWVAYHPPAPESIQLTHDMLLTLRDGWFALIMYYFGSSLGSYRKTMQANGK